MQIVWRILVGSLLALTLSTVLAKAAEPITDLRVLIDVSGSMKQNDPQNLRVPAVRMLVGLAPNGTRAGIWTFGKYTNMQIKHGPVNRAWKAKARAEARKIHSRALFTDIERALKTATADWKNPSDRHDRHLILLTDGVVDVSKDQALSDVSRERILEEILPELQRVGATIHSVALSENADHALLRQIALSTNGWYERVDSPERLQRIFLRLFEQSTPVDTLPLKGNRFLVDKSVSDVTLLAFSSPEGEPTALTSPSGQSWTAQSHPDHVRWHADLGYDLITIQKPEAGEWTLVAKPDPDNRVMVVTNLRLQMDELPNNLLHGEPVEAHAWLSRQNQIVANPDFLNLTQFHFHKAGDDSSGTPMAMRDDGNLPDQKDGDGIYTAAILETESQGTYEFVVRAESATFQRERRRVINIQDAPAEFSVEFDSESEHYDARVLLRPGILDPESVSVQLRMEGHSETNLERIESDQWRAALPATEDATAVTALLHGRRYDGRTLATEFERRLSPLPTEEAMTQAAQANTTLTNEQEETPERTSADEPKIEQAAAKEGSPQWLKVGVAVVALNILGAIAGFSVFYFMRKRRRRLAAERDSLFGLEPASADSSPASEEEPSDPPQALEPGAETAAESSSETDTANSSPEAEQETRNQTEAPSPEEAASDSAEDSDPAVVQEDEPADTQTDNEDFTESALDDMLAAIDTTPAGPASAQDQSPDDELDIATEPEVVDLDADLEEIRLDDDATTDGSAQDATEEHAVETTNEAARNE